MPSSSTVDAYLARIGLDRAPAVDLEGLTVLQAAHLSTVPFENLDVHARTGVRTDTGWSLPKIVDRHRGGWCFENNGAFGWLLGQLGFDVEYMGAFVLLDPPDIHHMNHLCLLVELDQPYLVDVGFGDAFNLPLPIDGRKLDDGNATFSVEFDDPWFTLVEQNKNVIDLTPAGTPQYRFERVARSLTEFDIESDLLQAGSLFTEKPFATRLIDGGPDRVTLLADRLKLREGGSWTETPVTPDEWDALYTKWFGR